MDGSCALLIFIKDVGMIIQGCQVQTEGLTKAQHSKDTSSCFSKSHVENHLSSSSCASSFLSKRLLSQKLREQIS